MPTSVSHANRLSSALLLAIAIITSTDTHAQVTNSASMTIQVNQPGAVVSSNLFGIFFEEINFAGEGGLYAEMVRNRSFKNSDAEFYRLGK